MRPRRSWWHRFRSSSAHTQANIVCTVLIMLATFAYATIAYLQWRAMNSQLTQMTKQADISDRALKTADRPWMGVEKVTIVLTQDQPAHLNVVLRNFGRSPAIHLAIHMGWQFNRPPSPTLAYLNRPLRSGDETSSSTIMPGQPTSGPDSVDKKLTPNATVMRLLKSGHARLYFFGEVPYRDSYGLPHVTHFCAIYSPTGDPVVCEQYNDAN